MVLLGGDEIAWEWRGLERSRGWRTWRGNCEKEQWTGSVVVEVGKLVAAGKVHSVECMEKPRAGVGMLQKMG